MCGMYIITSSNMRSITEKKTKLSCIAYKIKKYMYIPTYISITYMTLHMKKNNISDKIIWCMFSPL